MTRPGFPPALANSHGGTTTSPSTILGASLHSEFRANDPLKVLNAGNVQTLHNYGNDASNATNGTANQQPAYLATGFNGGPAFQGDGSNDILVSAFNAPITNTHRPYLWLVMQDGQAGTKYCATVRDAPLADTWFNVLSDNSGNGDWTSRRVSGADEFTDSTVSRTGKALVEVGWPVGGTAVITVNGTSVNNGNIALAHSLSAMELCGFAALSSFNNCIFAHAILASDVTAQQITNMRAFLRGANFPGYTANSYGLP
jgi:hypothetical protein